MPRAVSCPHCKVKTPYEGNPFRPFCSERCRLIDLGQWASGGYAIPGKSAEVEEDNPGSATGESDGNGRFPSED